MTCMNKRPEFVPSHHGRVIQHWRSCLQVRTHRIDKRFLDMTGQPAAVVRGLFKSKQSLLGPSERPILAVVLLPRLRLGSEECVAKVAWPGQSLMLYAIYDNIENARNPHVVQHRSGHMVVISVAIVERNHYAPRRQFFCSS